MSIADLKCCVLISGLPRSLRWTQRSMIERVIAPLRKAVGAVSCIAHFNLPAAIVNARSSENHIILKKPDVSALDLDMYCVEPQQDRNIASKFEIFKDHDLQAENTHQSHRNLLQAYRSLRQVWAMAAMIGADQSDIFVFLRPDLEYVDAWPVRELLDRVSSGASDIILPDWHDFGGLNDRMAIANRLGAAAYASRWDRVETFAQERVPRSSERLLQRAVELAGARCSHFASRAVRVRGDGRVENEGLDIPAARQLRWKVRHRFARMGLI